jgi:CMP-N-acetylneuraminic acid synthetase
VAEELGIDVPFMRPSELALDSTPTLPVVQHALAALAAERRHFDAVCLLQPTIPFRLPHEIDHCIGLLEKSGADSVVTVSPVPAHFHPCWVYFMDEDGLVQLSNGDSEPVGRRQDLPPVFHRDGSIYLTRYDTVMRKNSLYGSRVAGCCFTRRKMVNIDTLDDWAAAEAMVREVEELH